MSEIHTVTIGGESQEIKMTMGLLNELARTVGDIDRVGEISFDQELREAVLTVLLSKRDNKGIITEPLVLFTLDMTPEDTLELLDWVGSHVTDFLLKSLTRAKAMLEIRRPQFQSLALTSTGGEV